MKGIIDTNSTTFRQLMGNGLRYVIPRFQRDYSWEEEQWDDLWFDINNILKNEEEDHYMGYLVLQSNDNRTFIVIDGQQRLTTLSILVLSVLKCIQTLVEKNIEKEDNLKRIETLRTSYIGYTDPVTLVSDNKLKLNDNSDNYYRNYLVLLKEPPARNINASERGLRNCYSWFFDKVRERYTSGKDLASFIDNLSDRLYFTRIVVNDEFNAFKVFETLNSRGVQLSAADLLKNYLFSIVDESKPHRIELEELEKLWGFTLDKLKSERFEEFLRYFWNSRNNTVRKNQLYKVFRKNVNTKADVFSLMRDLDEYADIYMALQDPEDEYWKEKSEIKQALNELRIFQVKQPISLLMSGYKKLPENEFIKLLKAVVVVTFRYNIIGGYNPNELEEVYNKLAKDIYNSGSFSIIDLKPVYIEDDKFEKDFIYKTFKSTSRNNKIIKYILGTINHKIYGDKLDYESDLISVEHILPENPLDIWPGFSEDSLNRITYNIANMVLLEKKLNQEAGNSSYEIKRKIYLTSSCKETTDFAQKFDVWNETNFHRRAHQLAKHAKMIWRLNL